MQTIYKPKGKAGEYAELALNLYTGCSHGCTYCYVPRIRILHMTREEFMKPKPRAGIIEALKKDVKKYKDKEIFLSFTCDPYQPIELGHQLTRQAIEIIKTHGNRVRILTKSHLAERDFDLLNSKDWFGMTLTFISTFKWYEYEPHTAIPNNRTLILEGAKKKGINTWVSLEPVISPTQTLAIIKHTHDFVDEYRVGKWNYDKRADAIDWHKFVNEAIDLFEKYGKKYYIKESLKKYVEDV